MQASKSWTDLVARLAVGQIWAPVTGSYSEHERVAVHLRMTDLESLRSPFNDPYEIAFGCR